MNDQHPLDGLTGAEADRRLAKRGPELEIRAPLPRDFEAVER